jgi:hypothetical protein
MRERWLIWCTRQENDDSSLRDMRFFLLFLTSCEAEQRNVNWLSFLRVLMSFVES